MAQYPDGKPNPRYEGQRLIWRKVIAVETSRALRGDGSIDRIAVDRKYVEQFFVCKCGDSGLYWHYLGEKELK